MKLFLTANLLVASKAKRHSEKSNKDFYTIAVVTADGEAGNISCSEECYNDITDVFKGYSLDLTFNDQYNYMLATNAYPLENN